MYRPLSAVEMFTLAQTARDKIVELRVREAGSAVQDHRHWFRRDEFGGTLRVNLRGTFIFAVLVSDRWCEAVDAGLANKFDRDFERLFGRRVVGTKIVFDAFDSGHWARCRDTGTLMSRVISVNIACRTRASYHTTVFTDVWTMSGDSSSVAAGSTACSVRSLN